MEEEDQTNQQSTSSVPEATSRSPIESQQPSDESGFPDKDADSTESTKTTTADPSTGTLSSANVVKSQTTTAASSSQTATSQFTSTTTVSTTSTTTTAASFFSGGVLTRVRDLIFALVAGLVAQQVGIPGFGVPPVNREGDEGVFRPSEGRPSRPRPPLPPGFPRQPPIVVKDPTVRQKVATGSQGAFDGEFYNLTIPVLPEVADALEDEALKDDVAHILEEALGPDEPIQNVQITIDENKDGSGQRPKIIINAQTRPEDYYDESQPASSGQDNVADYSDYVLEPKVIPDYEDSFEPSPSQLPGRIPSRRPIQRPDQNQERIPDQPARFPTVPDDNSRPRVPTRKPFTKPTGRPSVFTRPPQPPRIPSGGQDEPDFRDPVTPPRFPGSAPGLDQPARPVSGSGEGTIPGTFDPSSPSRVSGSGGPTRAPSFRSEDKTRRPPASFTTRPPPASTTSRTSFELEDAVVTRRPIATSTTEDYRDFYEYGAADLIEDNNVIPPTIFVPQIPTYGGSKPNQEDTAGVILDSVPSDDNRVFDRRLNFLGGSSANIVEATVVEDLNYARSVRESKQSRIGIATISSITVGIIVLLAFGLIIFLALARRRRRKEEATTASSANMTPTQSR